MFKDICCFLYLYLLSFLDIKFRRVPDALVFCLFVTIFCSDIAFSFYSIPAYFLSAFLVFLILFFVAFLTHGLGIGDVKLAAILGFCFGFWRVLIAMILACLLGICAFFIFRIRKKNIRNLPFVPFLTFGCTFSLVFFRSLCVFI